MIRLLAPLSSRRAASRLIFTLSKEQKEESLVGNVDGPTAVVDESSLQKTSPEVVSSNPILRKCSLPFPQHLKPVQAWIESLQHYDARHLGLADLHPDVFAVMPRLDILHSVAIWQKNFKRISYAKAKTRAEMHGGGRKPWRQKGTGRARHGSIRSPIWHGGGAAFGPRGPTSYYYMLPMKQRVLGLKVALTSKHMQGDLHIVDSLEMPTFDPQYLTDVARYRHWGRSVLFVDVVTEILHLLTVEQKSCTCESAGKKDLSLYDIPDFIFLAFRDEIPENIQSATSDLKTFTVVPAIGLNVHSMLKYETLVLTLDTISFLEKKLLWHDSRYSPLYPFRLPYSDFP
ncbi:hypothetical protein E2320_016633 [Naja naja]|nr:hypothetical protein E2320_016633 [Naja naja]